MMKKSWKFGLHVHNYMSTGQRVPAGQRNPLRQEMWMSNPLEGYRIPVSAVRCLSTLSKTLMGPRAKACQGTRQSDGEPHTMVHWTLALTHTLPLRLQTQGPYHHCNTTQMYTTACGLAEAFGSTQTHTLGEPTRARCRWRYFLCVSGALTITMLTGKFTPNPQTLTRSLQGQDIFNFQGHSNSHSQK